MRSENMAKIVLNAVRLPKFEPVNGKSWSPRKIMVKDLRQRSGQAWFCACTESCVVFNTGPYTVLPDNSILSTANMQSETGFPSSHQLKSKSRLKLAARCPVSGCWYFAGLLVMMCVAPILPFTLYRNGHCVFSDYHFHKRTAVFNLCKWHF